VIDGQWRKRDGMKAIDLQGKILIGKQKRKIDKKQRGKRRRRERERQRQG
jgi:hypothetical protein